MHSAVSSKLERAFGKLNDHPWRRLVCSFRLLRNKVVSFEAPEVVLIAKDDSSKKDPTKKVVIYGSVSEQPSSYDLQWTQVDITLLFTPLACRVEGAPRMNNRGGGGGVFQYVTIASECRPAPLNVLTASPMPVPSVAGSSKRHSWS